MGKSVTLKVFFSFWDVVEQAANLCFGRNTHVLTVHKVVKRPFISLYKILSSVVMLVSD